MADEEQEIDEEADDEGEQKGSKKKLIIMIGLVLILLGGGGGAYMFMSGGDEETEDMATLIPAEEVTESFFFDLPDITINLASENGRSQYLRLKVTLELKQESEVDKVKPQIARVLDAFQIYLRELRVADLDGSAGIYRLKDELLRRINLSIYPAEIRAVLFKELLIQ